MTPSLLHDVEARRPATGWLVTWTTSRRRPVTVRALRGEQWFPQTPHDHAEGSWGASVVYEGEGSGFVDTQPAGGADTFYSLYSRRGAGPWTRPVNVRVAAGGEDEDLAPPGPGAGDTSAPAPPGLAAAGAGASAALFGSRAVVGRRDVAREIVAVLYPTLFTVALTLALLTTGIMERAMLSAAWALIALWRWHDRDTDDQAFAKWLLIPIAIVALAAVAKVTMAFRLPWNEHYLGRAEIVWFLLTVLGTAGVWLLAGRALTVARRARRLALLAAPVVVAAASPPVAAAAFSVYVVVDVVLARRDAHSR